jgi:hypothetical protein
VITRDIFIRRTPVSGKTVITCHRVWNADLFVASQVKQYQTDAKPADRCVITVASEAEYQAHRRQ